MPCRDRHFRAMYQTGNPPLASSKIVMACFICRDGQYARLGQPARRLARAASTTQWLRSLPPLCPESDPTVGWRQALAKWLGRTPPQFPPDHLVTQPSIRLLSIMQCSLQAPAQRQDGQGVQSAGKNGGQRLARARPCTRVRKEASRKRLPIAQNASRGGYRP